MMKIVAFDLDGTVADTIPMCIEAFCESVSPYTDHTLTEKEVNTPFPGIYELISWLKKHGILVALITGKGKRSCDISLKKLKLENIFDEVLYGSEKKTNKAENINFLIKKYSIPKSGFYYVGDTRQDVTICKEVGVTCLSAAWQKLSYGDILEKENKGLVFYSVSELREYLLALYEKQSIGR